MPAQRDLASSGRGPRSAAPAQGRTWPPESPAAARRGRGNRRCARAGISRASRTVAPRLRGTSSAHRVTSSRPVVHAGGDGLHQPELPRPEPARRALRLRRARNGRWAAARQSSSKLDQHGVDVVVDVVEGVTHGYLDVPGRPEAAHLVADELMAARGENSWPSPGTLVAARGRIHWALDSRRSPALGDGCSRLAGSFEHPGRHRWVREERRISRVGRSFDRPTHGAPIRRCLRDHHRDGGVIGVGGASERAGAEHHVPAFGRAHASPTPKRRRSMRSSVSTRIRRSVVARPACRHLAA